MDRGRGGQVGNYLKGVGYLYLYFKRNLVDKTISISVLSVIHKIVLTGIFLC